MSHVLSPSTAQQPSTYRFGCPLCSTSWSGDDLTTLAKNIAWHWNVEHGDELQHSYAQIDMIERGGHKVHDNEYVVERIPIYITAFDVIDRLGLEDGFAVAPEDGRMCTDCKQLIHDDANAVLVEESGVSETWRCTSCEHQREIEARREANHQLDSF